MKNNYYSVYSKGRNYKNLIDLRSRPIEERREIARKGGLARQEQRRKQLALRKALNRMLQTEDLISKYCKKPKSSKGFYIRGRNPYRNLNRVGTSFTLAMRDDLLEVYEKLEEEERQEEEIRAIRKKAIRKEINRRYYLKHKRALGKP